MLITESLKKKFLRERLNHPFFVPNRLVTSRVLLIVRVECRQHCRFNPKTVSIAFEDYVKWESFSAPRQGYVPVIHSYNHLSFIRRILLMTNYLESMYAKLSLNFNPVDTLYTERHDVLCKYSSNRWRFDSMNSITKKATLQIHAKAKVIQGI